MSAELTVSPEEILYQVKLSGQIPMILEEIAKRRAIAAAADEAGITVEPEELQQAADIIRLTNNLHRAEDTWAWLQKQGLSLDEFEAMLCAEILAEKLAKHLFENEVESFFVKHQLDYTQVAMYEIILDDEDLAMELFCAMQEGELNFHQIAHQYIQDQELRRMGGYRGLLHRSDLKPEVSAAVFSIASPQVFKPIITSRGAHLILVEEIIQPELDSTLRTKILTDLFLNWLKQHIKPVQLKS